MNMTTRLKRGTIGALLALLVFGAGAFADTQSTRQPVTLANVQGQRILQVTGNDLTGPASLAFGKNSTEAPFGVVVTDVAHTRTGYDVTATLSDLYKMDPTDPTGYDCNNSVASSRFSVGFGTTPTYAPEIAATLESLLTFTGETADLDTGLVKTLLIDAGISEVTAVVQGVVTDLATSVSLMDVTDGANGATPAFDNPAAHACNETPPATPSSRFLQTGATTSATGATFADDFFGLLDSTTVDGDATVDEVIAAGVLLTGTDQQGGQLYDATRAELASLLNGVDLGTLSLDAITAEVVAVMTTVKADIVLDLVGQSGIYANVPKLIYDPDPNAVTGLYQGTMTVTLTDK